MNAVHIYLNRSVKIICSISFKETTGVIQIECETAPKTPPVIDT